MRIRRSLPTLIFLVKAVVDEARDGLEEEKDEHDDADDWMVVRGAVGELYHVRTRQY